MSRWFVVAGLLCGMLCAVASAQTSGASIVVGNHVLAPNLAGQTVPVNVTGGVQIAGLDLDVEVAGGGAANGGTAGPVFTTSSGSFAGADLVTNTIFGVNNTGQQNITTQPQLYEGAIATSSGTVTANGLLATLSFDTTNIPTGTYSLKLANFANGLQDTDLGVDQNLNVIAPSVTNGNLIVTYPGDINLDGSVNFNDLVILARNYGKTGATWSTGDFNNDGAVGFDDLVTLARNYGNSINANPAPPALTAAVDPALVPEPATIGLLAAAGCLLLRRTRRL